MEWAIKPVESEEELRLANDLIAREHANGSGANRYWLETCGGRHPGQEPEHTRIAVLRGEVAGALRITTETVRIGEARLRAGSLGWLSTAPRHRGKGIAGLLMEDAVNYLRQHRYHVALLFGHPGIFHRFGFAPCLPDYAVLVEALEAAKFPPAFRQRPAKPGDISALQRIHAANDSAVDGSILRSRAHFTSNWQRCDGLQVLTDDQGKVAAYFIAEEGPGRLEVAEVGVAEPAACAGVLKACADRAADAGLRRIRFRVPPAHPLARFLLVFPSVHEIHVMGEGSGSMALVDVAEALESMIPEWESLLAASSAHDSRVEATLVVDGASYRLRANRGAVDVAALPGRHKVATTRGELIQMLSGFCSFEDLHAPQRALISSEARTFLRILFPRRTPYVWPFDRF